MHAKIYVRIFFFSIETDIKSRSVYDFSFLFCFDPWEGVIFMIAIRELYIPLIILENTTYYLESTKKMISYAKDRGFGEEYIDQKNEKPLQTL